MKQLFATKRDTNGNRYTLVIDHTEKTYSRTLGGWFHAEDVTATVTRRELHAMVDELKADGYTGREVIRL